MMLCLQRKESKQPGQWHGKTLLANNKAVGLRQAIQCPGYTCSVIMILPELFLTRIASPPLFDLPRLQFLSVLRMWKSSSDTLESEMSLCSHVSVKHKTMLSQYSFTLSPGLLACPS